MITRLFYILILSASMINITEAQGKRSHDIVYVGTFSESGQKGIYVYSLDRENASLSLIQSTGDLESPSYLAINPNGKYLYSVNRGKILPDKTWGSVSAFSIDQETGRLTHLNDQPAFGIEACYISTDSKGRYAFIANYSSGNITVFPINEDGTLGKMTDNIKHSGSSINKKRQEKPHVHCTYVSPDDRFLYVVDLGIDKIKVYEIDYENGKLIPLPSDDGQVEPGGGCRHITIHPNRKLAYVAEELSSSITGFRINERTGGLKSFQHIATIPETFSDVNYPADIHIDPTGKWLLASNRGHDSIVTYSINTDSGMLTLKGFDSVQGKWPRNFLIDPKGEFVFVANQNSDNVVLFRFNMDNGELSETGTEVSLPKPVCVKMLER